MSTPTQADQDLILQTQALLKETEDAAGRFANSTQAQLDAINSEISDLEKNSVELEAALEKIEQDFERESMGAIEKFKENTA